MRIEMKKLIVFFLLISFVPLANAAFDCDEDLAATTSYSALYCTYVTAPENVTKWIKVIDSLQGAVTECVSSKTSPLEYMKSQISDGSLDRMPEQHLMIILQCNNKECSNYKVLGTDVFNYDKAKHSLDHNKFKVALDPNFGDTCSDLEGSKGELIKWEQAPSK
jgi:hypothetical protein